MTENRPDQNNKPYPFGFTETQLNEAMNATAAHIASIAAPIYAQRIRDAGKTDSQAMQQAIEEAGKLMAVCKLYIENMMRQP